MNNPDPESRVEQELARAREALGGYGEEGVADRWEAFSLSHFQLPETPPEVLQSGEAAYLHWAMIQCVNLFDQGTQIAVSAAIQAFGEFLRRYESTQVFLSQGDPNSVLRAAAGQGREAFEVAMRQYVGWL